MKIGLTIADVEERLRAIGTPERAVGEKRYLKSDLEFLGASVPQVRRCANRWLRSEPGLEIDEIRRLAKALWRRRVHELRSFGVELLAARVDQLTVVDMELVEWILVRANTWAHVDPVAVKIGGSLVERHPDLEETLDRWVTAEELWLRRAALLVHLEPLRQGAGDWTRFTRYAGLRMEDKDFFIRKAIGWVLREAGKSTPQRVAEFVLGQRHRISGLSRREALKSLSPEARDRLAAAQPNR